MRNGFRRVIGASILCTLLLGFGLLILPVEGADAALVEPTLVEGNATCGSLDPTWVEFYKLDPVTSSGTWPATGPDYVTWSTSNGVEGQTIDWTATFEMAGVFVKGGNRGGHLYSYSPGVQADTGLHAPPNLGGPSSLPGDTWADISHVSFCRLGTTSTTPTTPPNTPPNTPPDTPPDTPPHTPPTSPPDTSPTTVLGEIGDFVWEDADGDGFQGAGELGVAGIEVKLLKGDATISTTITDLNGKYLFTGLAAGVYRVEFALPVGYEFTTANVVGDDALDSDANRNTGQTGGIALAAGEKDHTWDAGILRPTEVLPQIVVATTAPEVLPFTGSSDSPGLVGLASSLLALGGMAVLSMKRKEEQPVGGWSRRLPEVH
jgi:hypothetical protein